MTPHCHLSLHKAAIVVVSIQYQPVNRDYHYICDGDENIISNMMPIKKLLMMVTESKKQREKTEVMLVVIV